MFIFINVTIKPGLDNICDKNRAIMQIPENIPRTDT